MLTGSTSVLVLARGLKTLSTNLSLFCSLLASVARHLYIRPGAGVGTLKCMYGGRKNRGTRPSHHADASGSVSRKVVQALEKLKLVEKTTEGGRRISREGQRDLDHVAALCAKSA